MKKYECSECGIEKKFKDDADAKNHGWKFVDDEWSCPDCKDELKEWDEFGEDKDDDNDSGISIPGSSSGGSFGGGSFGGAGGSF